MKDLMIDIETLATNDRPPLLQLAGVYFDRYTGELGKEFCTNFDLQECIEEGFYPSSNTLFWWLDQDKDIFKELLSGYVDLKEGLGYFREFANGARYIWSHSTFDFVIVQTYLTHFNIKNLPYKNARDIRTLVDLSGINLENYDWSQKSHNALNDCRFQIKYCVDAFNEIK